MEDTCKACLWKNFAATVDMLEAVIKLCPDALWKQEDKFYYLAYHTAIFLDYYLTYPVDQFDPRLPYVLVPQRELPADAVDDVLPVRHYSTAEVISSVRLARSKCQALIGPQAIQDVSVPWITPAEIDLHGLCPGGVMDYSLLDILFYNLRHVQHHVAQLNYILRNEANLAAEWISQAE
ncbi:hypothetical protein CLV84_3988 [Neolewinella xylanilytica]|uniref:DinB family protein n=1 Tax=Neolewinella xylanilytica TaxID=1514080 RepID=A0A2S6I049_9BACT|nr:hypothetical protein [Neolewinella xylanilytica]PPK84220.1 hypothetical protein CLV84_3988 [Neolewinella xylanilytica]